MALAMPEKLWFSPLTDPLQRLVMIQRMPGNCSTGVSLACQHLWDDELHTY